MTSSKSICIGGYCGDHTANLKWFIIIMGLEMISELLLQLSDCYLEINLSQTEGMHFLHHKEKKHSHEKGAKYIPTSPPR